MGYDCQWDNHLTKSGWSNWSNNRSTARLPTIRKSIQYSPLKALVLQNMKQFKRDKRQPDVWQNNIVYSHQRQPLGHMLLTWARHTKLKGLTMFVVAQPSYDLAHTCNNKQKSVVKNSSDRNETQNKHTIKYTKYRNVSFVEDFYFLFSFRNWNI